jgi:PAS domain S-box-containing protein
VDTPDHEEPLLRSVALQNANSILLARQRSEEELLRTKEALRESQERLTAALAAAGTGTFRWNMQTNTVEWDGNLNRLFGLDAAQKSQSLETFVAAIHPDDRPELIAAIERCTRDRSDFDMEFRVVWPDGTVHWIHDKARAFYDAAGNPLYMTGACAEVTSQKMAAESLRESEERLRAMFNQAAVGIAVAALDGHFLDMNKRFSDILGYTPEELRRLTFTQLTHPDELAETTTAVSRLLDGSISEYALEKRYLRKDGSALWSLTTVTLLKDAAGRPQRFIGVIEDITPRKQAEAALREETRILELLNETGKKLGSQLDPRAVAQAVTDAATALSGAEFGAFFYHTIDGGAEAFQLYTISGQRDAFAAFGERRAVALVASKLGVEAPIQCSDAAEKHGDANTAAHRGSPAADRPLGSYLAVAVRSRTGAIIGGLLFGHSQPEVFTERGERVIAGVAAQAGVAIDNAQLYEKAQKAAEERSALLESERAARNEAERMSDVKDAFLATLSHELRTPLNAILGWAQILKNAPKDRTDLLKGLDTIERNARVQTQLIEDLLDMSRITTGKLRLDVQPIQPMSFIEAAVETVQPAAEAKGIHVETVLDPDAGPISGDPNRLQQVIWNLLSNAVKFTPREGKIQILLERVDSHIEISVADTGVGIRPELIPHLFERFRQGDASTTRKYGGLGLGLSIVKSLVELHGGSVAVSSAGEGLGTTVTVVLPLTIVHRSAARTRPDGSAQDSGFITEELSGVTVLVVDDQPDARDLIRRVLEECAADVITASTAVEALELIESRKPDVLVSDIGMPEADGFELLRRVRALGAERGGRTPAIALTAFARSEDRIRALRAGFVVHVSKPVDPSELIATVASVAGRVDDLS